MMQNSYAASYWMVEFYRKLIAHFADVVLPFSEMLRLSPKGSFVFNEPEKNKLSVQKSSVNYLNSPTLQPMYTNYQLVNYAVGETRTVLDSFRRNNTLLESRYNTFDREYLSVYSEVRHSATS